ncbi:hypothetical protein TNCV_21181 [Trichonephila clavipes]|nr:hypothetical protein TNCV_21181 [Trichonephila clavipes]
MNSNIRSKPTEFIAAWGWILMPVVSRRLEHYAGNSTILLSSTPILRENILGEVRIFQLSPHSTSLTRELETRRLFGVPSFRKVTLHVQTSMPFP